METLQELESMKRKLYIKALKAFPNSPVQLKIKRQINVVISKINNIKKPNNHD